MAGGARVATYLHYSAWLRSRESVREHSRGRRGARTVVEGGVLGVSQSEGRGEGGCEGGGEGELDEWERAVLGLGRTSGGGVEVSGGGGVRRSSGWMADGDGRGEGGEGRGEGPKKESMTKGEMETEIRILRLQLRQALEGLGFRV